MAIDSRGMNDRFDGHIEKFRKSIKIWQINKIRQTWDADPNGSIVMTRRNILGEVFLWMRRESIAMEMILN